MVHGGIEEDLLEALKELLVASESLWSGETPTGEERDRYETAVDRARRVIARAER
jgi:hypothetical protein